MLRCTVLASQLGLFDTAISTQQQDYGASQGRGKSFLSRALRSIFLQASSDLAPQSLRPLPLQVTPAAFFFQVVSTYAGTIEP